MSDSTGLRFEDYITRLSKLRRSTDKSKWPSQTKYAAPYKPLLLLSVFDLIEQGVLTNNFIELTPELGQLFSLYCAKVLPSDIPGNIGMPFYHLKSDGFWHLIPRQNFELETKISLGSTSTAKIKKFFLGAKFDEALFKIVCIPDARNTFRKALIETYFEKESWPVLKEQVQVNAAAFTYSQLLLKLPDEKTKVSDLVIGPQEYVKQVRDQAFRRAVVQAYDHRCANCGVKVVTADGHTAVEAAHIIPWSKTHNDSVTNGMALCRLCHWAFDEGVTGVSKEYNVLASEQLTLGENAPWIYLMVKGRPIFKPDPEERWPDLEALSWHRKNTFKGI
jgi:putative restriction endonuclease